MGLIRLPAVKTRTGKSRSSIYRDVNAGLFPSPVKIGPRAVGWREEEIDRWEETRPRAGDAAADSAKAA